MFYCIRSGLLALLLLLPLLSQAAVFDTENLEQALTSLQAEGETLLAAVESLTLTPLTLGSQLSAVENDLKALRDGIAVQFASVDAARVAGSTVALDAELLVLLQNLAAQSAALAQGLLGLAEQVSVLSATTAGTTIVTAAYTLLRLSDDIGTMADRILEMADKILVMADNIGLMADRILATQIIQNTNIALVVDATLQTQRNAITLIALFT